LMVRKYFKRFYPKYRFHIFLVVLGYYLKNYKQYDPPFPIKSREDLKKITQLLKFPIRTKEYVSKRTYCKVIFRMQGVGKRIVLSANGVGIKQDAWNPLIKYFADLDLGKNYTYVTWDYPGLFGSEAPRYIRMTVRDFAEDCMELLEKIREDRGEGTNYYAVIGWSTGVQVALELALLYPDSVEKLVLMSGTHGHALQSAWQPLCRLPCVGYALHEVFIFLRKHAGIIYPFMNKCGMLGVSDVIGLLTLPLWLLRGQPSMRWVVTLFCDDVTLNGKAHVENLLTILCALDHHSVYPLAQYVEQETLILVGYLDFITPSYLSYELHSKIPNSRLRCWSGGSHFLLLEYPEEVSTEILQFLEESGEIR